MQGPHEIETKFRVADRARLEGRLAALGARRGETQAESDVLFDDASGSLKEKGCALRVRTVKGRGLLTYKGPAAVDAGVKNRLELESDVASPQGVAAILEALGFRAVFRYEKHRTAWIFADPGRAVVVVDETPLGLFAEIEGTDASVRALASELGVAESDFIAESYVALWLAARRADPSLPYDMVFSP